MPDRQSCMQATFFHHIYDSPAKGLTNYLRCYSPALLREHIHIETTAVMGMGFGDISGSSRTPCCSTCKDGQQGPMQGKKKRSNQLLGQHLELIICPAPGRKMAGWVGYYTGCVIYIKARKYSKE